MESLGAITHAIGVWLRKNNVSALIFPSARSDCAVCISDGDLQESYGWNLVDFRGSVILISAQVDMISLVNDWSPWPDFPYSAKLKRTGPDSNFAGSWQLIGVEAEGLRRSSALLGTTAYPSWTTDIGTPSS
jgi:hypothetical protein